MCHGMTRVLLVVRGTETIARCVGLVSDTKMKMEEWDTLLKHRQPKSNYKFIDDHDCNCTRDGPSHTSGEADERDCLWCGISYKPTTCENTTANPGACFTVYYNKCWEEEQTNCKDRSRRIVEWQRHNVRSSPFAIPVSTKTLKLQLTLFSRDDDQTLLVSGCGTDAGEGEIVQKLDPPIPLELESIAREDVTGDDTRSQVENEEVTVQMHTETDFIKCNEAIEKPPTPQQCLGEWYNSSTVTSVDGRGVSTATRVDSRVGTAMYVDDTATRRNYE